MQTRLVLAQVASCIAQMLLIRPAVLDLFDKD